MSSQSHKTIGLFFGSFNPVHIGHLIIADYFVQFSGIDEIWFVVSPQNPFKTNQQMLNEKARLNLVRLATENNPCFKVTDIEFNMERPSYTYNTLKKLISLNPGKEFVLIAGSDNLDEFDKWKNYDAILSMVDLYVYPRHGFTGKEYFVQHPKVFLKPAPVIEISSSYIRKIISSGKDAKYYLPENVYREITVKKYYR